MIASLVGRVGLGAALACVATALVSTAVTGLVTVTLVEQLDERRVREAATVLADELEIEIAHETVPEIVEDEIEEMKHTGLAFAVIDAASGELVAGSALLPRLRARACRVTDGLRACAVPALNRVWVVSGEPTTSLMVPLATASAAAVLIAAVLGWVVSLPLARWLVRPLLRLRDRVVRLDPRDSASSGVGEPTGAREVDTLRDALVSLIARVDTTIRTAERFAIDASHELRTPLTTMRGELDLMLETDVPAKADLTRVRAKVIELNTLTERLLLLAVPSSGTWTPHELIDLNELVTDVVADLGVENRVRLTLASESPAVRGDTPLLATLLTNAVGNALKFGQNAEVRVRRDGEELVLDVLDDGPGVPRELRERVFEPFFRDPAQRRLPGQGLGLAVVASVAARHGGRASFIDGADGAHLEVRLPRAQTTLPNR